MIKVLLLRHNNESGKNELFQENKKIKCGAILLLLSAGSGGGSAAALHLRKMGLISRDGRPAPHMINCENNV